MALQVDVMLFLRGVYKNTDVPFSTYMWLTQRHGILGAVFLQVIFVLSFKTLLNSVL